MKKTLSPYSHTQSAFRQCPMGRFSRTRMAMGAALLASLAFCGAAQADGHYSVGVEGIQAASVPPPGLYAALYAVNYSIDSFRAPGSRDALPGHNKGTVSALAGRMVWISSHKVLGADYGMETIVPFQRSSLTVNAAGISDTRTGLGDIYLGPVVLGWHGPRWDAGAGLGWWLDNGSTSHPASPGKGYKSFMLTGGATWYFDDARSLSASGLMRWERHGRAENGIRPGNQVSLEWGIGKALGPVQVGMVGYSQWQTGTDKGIGASDAKFSKHAIGAEVVYPVPGAGLFLKTALYREWRVKSGTSAAPQGSMLRMSLVKAF